LRRPSSISVSPRSPSGRRLGPGPARARETLPLPVGRVPSRLAPVPAPTPRPAIQTGSGPSPPVRASRRRSQPTGRPLARLLRGPVLHGCSVLPCL